MSGKGTASGVDFQAQVAAYISVHILCQKNLGWIDSEDLPTSVACEQAGAGDDVRVELANGWFLEVQAKRSLTADERLEQALVTMLSGLRKMEIGVIITDSESSKSVRVKLRNFLNRTREGLAVELPKGLENRCAILLNNEYAESVKRLHIVEAALDYPKSAAANFAQAMILRHLSPRAEPGVVWDVLVREFLQSSKVGSKHNLPTLRSLLAQKNLVEPSIRGKQSKTTTNLPPNTRHFGGRDAELQELKSAFSANRGQAYVHVIAGFSGMGKSQLAIAFAHQSMPAYRVTWITSSVDEASLAQCREAIGQDRSETFLILDNVMPSTILTSLIALAEHILITTTSGDFGIDFPVMEIRPLLRSDSIAALRQMCPHLSGDACAKIASDLGDYPLAIAQAGAYCARTGCSASDYSELLLSHGGTLFEQGASQLTHYTTNVKACVRIAINQVRVVDPHAMTVSWVFMFMDSYDIPLDVLRGPLSAFMGVPAIQIDQAYATLASFSIIEITGHNASFHALIQRMWFEETLAANRQMLAQRVLQLIFAIVPNPQTHLESGPYSEIHDHAVMCIEKIRAEGIPFDQRLGVHILTGLGMWHVLSDRPRSGLALQQRACELVDSHTPPDLHLSALNNLAVALRKCGMLDNARGVLEKVVQSTRQHFGDSDIVLGFALDNLGQVNHSLRDFEEAERAYREALQVKMLHADSHPTAVAVTMGNLALLAASRGDYPMAIEELHAALRQYRLREEECRAWIASVLGDLAQVYSDSGQYENAFEYGEEGVRMSVGIFGLYSEVGLNSAMSHVVLRAKKGGEEAVCWIKSFSRELDPWSAALFQVNSGATLRSLSEEKFAEEILLLARDNLETNAIDNSQLARAVEMMLSGERRVVFVALPEMLPDSILGDAKSE